MARLLIIDDKVDRFIDALELVLSEHTLQVARSGREGLDAIERGESIDCVLLDVTMPPTVGRLAEQEGLVVLDEIRRRRAELPVLMLTSSSEAHHMVRAMRRGAFHYIVKPPDTALLRSLVDAALANRQLHQKVHQLEQTLAVRDELDEATPAPQRLGRLVGRSPAMQLVFGRLTRVAPREVPVLILGESGTGKELVARELHARSTRRDGPFHAVNCANLGEAMLESELFGHRKGAFTGATECRDGAFRSADGGTLLLDEIGEMSPSLQARLLRTLQDGVVRPLGSDRDETVDVRVLAATHRDIDKQVRDGQFRQDLFYRLNVVRLVLPPLRQRPGDVRLLARHLLSTQADGVDRSLSSDALNALDNFTWPGNVRQLENVLQRASILSEGPVIDVADLGLPGADDRPACWSDMQMDRLWQATLDGRTPTGLSRFAELYGKLALRRLVDRACSRYGTDREAGRRLGFIPEDDPGDRAFNNFRRWKSRLARLGHPTEATSP